MKKVLFVCHGNICRSPMAEYIFKYYADSSKYYAESRALSQEEIGNDIYPFAKKILSKNNIPFDRHFAKRITNKDYEDFDDIFVMEDSNMVKINNLINDKDHKIKKLAPFNIEDPWYTGNFEKVFNEIKEAIIKYLNI